MKILKISIALIFLILFCIGCSTASFSPRPSISPTSSSENFTTSPTPSIFVSPTAPISSVEPVTIGADATPTSAASNPGLFTEENFTKYFQFGMSMSAVEKKLKSLNIAIDYKTKDDRGNIRNVSALGFWKICTDSIQFNFDKNRRLYEMDIADWATAKGYVPGDSVDKLHQLYGKEDDLDTTQCIFDNCYVYYKSKCYFSVQIFNGIGSPNDSEPSWSVYADIWNDPQLLNQGTKSSNLMAHKLHSDDSIAFNEENFSCYFSFGMSQSALREKLNSLGVRITDECNGGSTISTDHVVFYFKDKKGLSEIDVQGWPTAKGLSPGETEAKLHQLYGKENDQYNSGGETNIYTYFLNGYPKSRNGFQFILEFGDYNHMDADALAEWIVSVE